MFSFFPFSYFLFFSNLTFLPFIFFFCRCWLVGRLFIDLLLSASSILFPSQERCIVRLVGRAVFLFRIKFQSRSQTDRLPTISQFLLCTLAYFCTSGTIKRIVIVLYIPYIWYHEVNFSCIWYLRGNFGAPGKSCLSIHLKQLLIFHFYYFHCHFFLLFFIFPLESL